MRAVLLATLLLFGGCDLIAGEDPFPERCPDEDFGSGSGYDAGKRECLWKAYTEGRAASFKTTRVTAQGDPIITEVTVRPGNPVEIFHDSSLDTFTNVKGKYTLSCTIFQKNVDPSSGRIRFFADNCRGGPVRALVF